ncbi:MAG: hypothetical protein AABX82_01130, partial [Nanoarchaeota archaeon]
MTLKKKDWYYLGQWVAPTLCACLWDNWTNYNTFPFPAPQFSGKYLMLHGHSYVKKNDISLLKEFIQKKEGDFTFLEELQKWVDNVAKNAEKNVRNASGNLPQKIKTIHDAYKDIGNPWIFFLAMDDYLSEKIKECCIEFHCSEEEVLKQIILVRKPYAVQQVEEACALHKIILERRISCKSFEELAAQNPAIAQKVEQHINKFIFCGLHHFVGKKYSYEEFLAKKSLLSSQNQVKITATEIRKETLPPTLHWYISLASIAAFARTNMAETSGILQYHTTPTLMEVNKTLGLNKGEYIWLSFQEIFSALQEPSTFSVPDILPRQNKLAVFSENNKEIILVGKALDDILSSFISVAKEKVFPLKGMPACKGIIQGTVKIIILPDDIKKMKAGDILVAPETAPDFLPAMA